MLVIYYRHQFHNSICSCLSRCRRLLLQFVPPLRLPSRSVHGQFSRYLSRPSRARSLLVCVCQSHCPLCYIIYRKIFNLILETRIAFTPPFLAFASSPAAALRPSSPVDAKCFSILTFIKRPYCFAVSVHSFAIIRRADAAIKLSNDDRLRTYAVIADTHSGRTNARGQWKMAI